MSDSEERGWLEIENDFFKRHPLEIFAALTRPPEPVPLKAGVAYFLPSLAADAGAERAPSRRRRRRRRAASPWELARAHDEKRQEYKAARSAAGIGRRGRALLQEPRAVAFEHELRARGFADPSTLARADSAQAAELIRAEAGRGFDLGAASVRNAVAATRTLGALRAHVGRLRVTFIQWIREAFPDDEGLAGSVRVLLEALDKMKTEMVPSADLYRELAPAAWLLCARTPGHGVREVAFRRVRDFATDRVGFAFKARR